MKRKVIKNVSIVNEGSVIQGDLYIEGARISKIGGIIDVAQAQEIDGTGLHLLPGVIDDQVHFRQPGLTHKATIYTESKAAVAGGVTSFMEMPNTQPPTLDHTLLEQKYAIAQVSSLANFSFFLGASESNIEEIKSLDPTTICGVKIFLGSSTGNLLVEDEAALNNIFQYAPTIISTHCEDELTIRTNTERYKSLYGDTASANIHPMVRSRDACIISTKKAIRLAERHQARLNILHISTAEEVQIIAEAKMRNPNLTAEVCVHHLHFSSRDYDQLGNFIKCNPAIKEDSDRKALWRGLMNDHLDLIATDHAPHTEIEKKLIYWQAPSGLPLIQESLVLMLEKVHQGMIDLTKLVEKMCHQPARIFKIAERGFIREGYYADLVMVDLASKPSLLSPQIFAKCGWSPLAGMLYKSKIESTMVNGHLVYNGSIFDESVSGMRMKFS